MKAIIRITLVLLFLTSFKSFSQNPVPNPGFELWWYTAFWTIEADGWWSNNSEVAAWNVIPDSNAYAGTLALKLIKLSYTGVIHTGFPVAFHPASLSGYVNINLAWGDQANISVVAYQSGVPVDSGSMIFFGGTSTGYQPFTVPVSQTSLTADSCVIVIAGGTVYQSSISFDELVLSDLSDIPSVSDDDRMFVFPSPATDHFTLKYDGLSKYSVTVLDPVGQIIQTRECKFPITQFNCSDWAAGVYFLRVEAAGRSVCKPIIIKP